MGQARHSYFLATTSGFHRPVLFVHGLGLIAVHVAPHRRHPCFAGIACGHIGTHGGHRASKLGQISHAHRLDGGFSCWATKIQSHAGFGHALRA